MKNTALIVSGIIFSLVTLAHLLRLIFHIKLVAAGYVLPMTISSVGIVVFLLLAIWMFMAAKST